MRTDRRQWLAPLLAALLLLTGAVPASAIAAPARPSPAAEPAAGQSAAPRHDRPALDDAVRAELPDRAERGNVNERSPHAALFAAGTADLRATTTGPRSAAAGIELRAGGAPNEPRAPPGSPTPIPS